MLVLNYIDITAINDGAYHFLKGAVSTERQLLANQFVFLDDAKRCVLSELLLQYSFLRTKKTILDVEIVRNAYGKPSLAGMSDFSYNISHSGKWVVIAYGEIETEIGLDIEEINFDQGDLPIHAFTRIEQAYITAVFDEKERVRRFTQLWTLKESYVKYIGTGLSTDLDSFSVLMREPIKVQDGSRVQEDIHLKHCLFQEDYYLSVCSREEKMVIHEVTPRELMEFVKQM